MQGLRLFSFHTVQNVKVTFCKLPFYLYKLVSYRENSKLPEAVRHPKSLADACPCAVSMLHYPCILTGKFTSVGHFTTPLTGTGSYKITVLTSERVSLQYEFLSVFVPVFHWIFANFCPKTVSKTLYG